MDPAVDLALHSRPLKVGINIDGYYYMKKQTDGQDEITGFCVDLMNTLSESLKFSYELVMPADGKWGDEYDGQWTGLLGLLQRKEIDMAMLLAPSVQRGKVVQWTVPIEYWYNNIAVRTHDVQLDLWTAFFSPFQWSVYTYLFLTFVMCTSLLWHVMRTERLVWMKREQAWSRSDVCLFLYGSVLSRGLTWNWAGGTGRTVIACWCIMGILLTSCYTCKLTSLLVGVTSSPPFTSVEEMLANDEYRWGVLGETKLVQILRESNSSTEQELYTKLMAFAEDDPDVLSRDFSVHLSKVLTENYAFLSISPILEVWAAEHCEITVLPIKLTGLEYFSILLPNDSIITDAINGVLLRLHDTGSLAYIRSRWFPSATRCRGNRSPGQTFSLATLQGPFYAAAAGLLLAAGVLCVERCGHRRATSCREGRVPCLVQNFVRLWHR